MSRVLILREAAEAERTAVTLAGLGHQPLILPLERTVDLDPGRGGAFEADDLAGFAATSARAVPALGKRFAGDGRPLLAVGAATALAGEAAGFGNVHVAGGAASSMGELALSAGIKAGETLLYAAGRRRTGTLEASLAKVGIRCVIEEVYDIVPVSLSEGVVRSVFAGGPPDFVLLLSAGQAEGYGRLTDEMPQLFRPSPRLLALSVRVRDALPQSLREGAAISTKSSLASLFELID
ncbi:uroporphyrinogen-III synthase [Jiella mangrovi]|uniref:Uroporphyrinogen-III synthase n=1 Tax=Jiella mangrovi TaxID=2821407 RepID=A0ABS4BDJ7_9HYPH|nr:uroporphyrinogen-III synthase [Jiella mangrovi]MBP0614820.1 uroporphyrinogen-III synthase [Jiella mangrovi]